MSQVQRRLITYCTNIHPGESWPETFSAIREHIPAVKESVSPEAPFPIGLRLSDNAARQLTGQEVDHFTTWLGEKGCFVPTLNGFPYGSFHGDRVKERVYLPDWRSEERSDYTIRLADLLSAWLPDAVTGSISTVPLGFKGCIPDKDLSSVVKQLHRVLIHLARIYEEQGKSIVLALEPEPGCLLETTEEVCCFFGGLRFADRLRHHLGICFDCCHQAVEFEEPETSLAQLKEHGVPIAKVQISTALTAFDAGLSRLACFAEDRYLHQVSIRRADGTIARFADLPQALAGHGRHSEDEWRCHFHVPVFLPGFDGLGTTRAFTEKLLPLLPPDLLLEVETYTWGILPAELRGDSVTESIIREISWVKDQLNASHCRH